MNYSEKLLDPRWQKKRLKCMEYANWRCQICGVKDRTLHCHHSYYTKGKQPWQYPDGSIICICDKCHAKIHDRPKPAPAPVEVYVPPEPAADALPHVAPKSRFAQLREMLERGD